MPSKTTSKSILNFAESGLGQLTQQINQQLVVLKRIRSVLNEDLGAHAIHCLTHGDKLMLYTDSPTWASQLRFYREPILAAVSQQIKTLEIKVIIRLEDQYKSKPTPPIIPSQAVINNIKNVGSCINDEALKQALERLSSRLSQAKAKQ